MHSSGSNEFTTHLSTVVLLKFNSTFDTQGYIRDVHFKGAENYFQLYQIHYLDVTILPADTCLLTLEELRHKRHREFYGTYAQNNFSSTTDRDSARLNARRELHRKRRNSDHKFSKRSEKKTYSADSANTKF